MIKSKAIHERYLSDFRHVREFTKFRRWRCSDFISLTIGPGRHLVKGMKLTDKMIQRMVQSVFKELKSVKAIQFKEKEDVVLKRGVEIIKKDLDREIQLDRDVNKMMDDLERQNPGEFQRYKMFPLLKKRLAKEKGIVI